MKKSKLKNKTINNNSFLEGKFISKERGYGFVELAEDIKNNDELDVSIKRIYEESSEKDIFISKNNNKLNALDGDIVLVKLLDKEVLEGRSLEGEIVKILDHKNDTVVGVFQKSKSFGFLVPDNKNFGTDVFIPKNACKGAKNGQKVVAKITRYPINGKNAEGKVIEILGNVDAAGVDMLSLIKEYKLPYEFPKGVLNEARNINQLVDKKDIPNRVDLRDKTIFTIDGEDAKDLDDAVAVYKNEEGNYVLEVHIADVSYYVKSGSELDKEARLRGTSVYMLDRVIPMLPFELSNGICSLNAGEERFTLSVTMEIDKNGKVIDSDIYKAIIKVTERMSYTDVYKIITNSDDKICKKYEKYINNFKLMEELAKILKQRRLKQGYLNLDIPESKIVLDEFGKCIDVKKYETTFANEIIEQFMLTANETVAEKFFWLEVPFIYRVHEEPDIEKVKELNKFLYNFKYKIKVKKDEIYPTEFSKLIENIKGKDEERVILNLILRTLKLARYESKNIGHFGIASKYYCHFTSPIRRYPDLFIHRVISEYFDSGKNKKVKFLKQAEKYAKTSSEAEKVAQKVERESIDIKKAEYMESKVGEIFEGTISNVTNFGVYVELENTVEGLIRFENLGNEYFIYDDEHKCLIGEKSRRIYKVGDKITIKVIEANKILRRISFAEVAKDAL